MGNIGLRQKALSGIKWSAVSSIITNGCEFSRIAILAHLLSPSDFGLMSMLMVVTGFAQAFSDAGISNAIIQKQEPSRAQLSSLYWLNIIVSVLIGVIIILLSPLLSEFYREPRLTQLLFYISLNFLIIPFGQQFQALLQKELRFDILTKIEVTSTLLSAFFSIYLAFKGYGVYSLISGILLNSMLRSGILMTIGWKHWKPDLHFRFVDLKEYLEFGLYQMGERSVNYLSANVDYLFVGKFLGAHILGIYTLAYQLVVMPFIKINPIITRVAFPIFSKRQKDDLALQNGYIEMLRLISFLVFPVLIGIVAIAPTLIPVIYGSGWEKAIPLVQILAIMGFLKTLGNSTGSILLAKGRADIGFKWNIIAVLVNVLAFSYAIRYGVFAIAWTWNILCATYSISMALILDKIIGLSWKKFISSFLSFALISIVMGISVYLIGMVLRNFRIDNFLLLIGLITVGFVFYLILVFIFKRTYLENLFSLFKQAKGSI